MTNQDLAENAASTNTHRRIGRACLAILIVAIVAIPMASAGRDGIRRIDLTAPYESETGTRSCTEPCGSGSTSADPTTGGLDIEITMPQGAVSDRRTAQVGSEYVLHKAVPSLAIVARLHLQAEGKIQGPADHLELGVSITVSGGTCDASFVLEHDELLADVGENAWLYPGWLYTTAFSGPREVRLFVPHDRTESDCLRQPGTFVASAGAYLHAWSASVDATGQPVGLGLGSTTSLWAQVESITVELHQ